MKTISSSFNFNEHCFFHRKCFCSSIYLHDGSFKPVSDLIQARYGKTYVNDCGAPVSQPS